MKVVEIGHTKAVEITLPGRAPYAVGPLTREQAEWVSARFERSYPEAATRIAPASEFPRLGTKMRLGA